MYYSSLTHLLTHSLNEWLTDSLMLASICQVIRILEYASHLQARRTSKNLSQNDKNIPVSVFILYFSLHYCPKYSIRQKITTSYRENRTNQPTKLQQFPQNINKFFSRPQFGLFSCPAGRRINYLQLIIPSIKS